MTTIVSMQTIWFEKHPGLYSDEFDYYNFYGLYFNSILDVASFFKHIKCDPETRYEGFLYKGLNCLKDVSTDIIYINKGGYLPDETFLDDYIKRYGKPKSR